MNLDIDNHEKCRLLCHLEMNYNDTDNQFTISNTGESIIIDYKGENYVNFRNNRYNLESIEINIPTLVQLNYIHYDIELLFKHKSVLTKDVLVISVFGEVSDETNSTDTFFKEVMSASPKKKSSVRKTFSYKNGLKLLFPELLSFYNFRDGSHHYVLFDNVVPVYYEFFRNIKNRIKILKRKYPTKKDITLYYNDNLDTQVAEKSSSAALHFVKCRKVRRTQPEKASQQKAKEKKEVVDLEIPSGIITTVKMTAWVISYIATFLLVVLIIKLINRSCGVEKFTQALKGIWGRVTQVGKKGVDAIKRRRRSGQ